MVITRGVPLTKSAITKEDVLKSIPQHYVDSVIIREHLDRELVLGTIGDRGGGKSGTDAALGVVAFMFRGKKVWSNMKIKCDIEIDDETARKHGLNSGGVAHYESQPIVKDALLKLDETYRDGCLVIEEINVQYSNVRRFMSNTNVDFNEVCQQLRKFKVSMLYNVIDEMFIDPQLRALSDMFIRTYDTAFDLDSLNRKKPAGLDFCWQIYPMSGYMRGEQGRYATTHKSEKCFFHFGLWRGIYDSGQHQEKGRYSLNKRERAAELKAELEIKETEDFESAKLEYYEKWGDIDAQILQIKDSRTKEISRYELFELLGTSSDLDRELDEHLVKVCHLRSRWSNGEKFYIFPAMIFGENRE